MFGRLNLQVFGTPASFYPRSGKAAWPSSTLLRIRKDELLQLATCKQGVTACKKIPVGRRFGQISIMMLLELCVLERRQYRD